MQIKSESAVNQLSMCGSLSHQTHSEKHLQSDFLPGTWSCTAPPDVWPRTCCSPWWRPALSLLLLLLLSLRRQNTLCVDNPPLTSKRNVLDCVFTGCGLDCSPVFQPFWPSDPRWCSQRRLSPKQRNTQWNKTAESLKTSPDFRRAFEASGQMLLISANKDSLCKKIHSSSLFLMTDPQRKSWVLSQ